MAYETLESGFNINIINNERDNEVDKYTNYKGKNDRGRWHLYSHCKWIFLFKSPSHCHVNLMLIWS